MDIGFNKLLYSYLTIIPIPRGCHQLPERSLFYQGNQYPICARCAGIALGQLFGILSYLLIFIFSFSDLTIKPMLFSTAILSVPMGIDWGIQYFFNIISTNRRRFLSGFICGFGFGGLYLSFIVLILTFLTT